MQFGQGNTIEGCTAQLERHKNPTLTERLSQQKVELERKLAEINAVLLALEKNPELQNLFDLIARI